MSVQGVFNPGDVVRYETLTRPDRWCREGTAIAVKQGGVVRLLDTYWCLGTETHVLTTDEAATAEFRFNLNDYDELDVYDRGAPAKWERYAEADREVVTEQHGHRRRWFVRKGAVEDRETIVANAAATVDKRERELEVAQDRLAWARQELAAATTALDGAQ